MRLMHPKAKLITFIATSSLLLACSHNTPAPVFELSSKTKNQKKNNQSPKNQSIYVVKPGDTLFSIAWEHSVDFKDLARINKLKRNLIYPDQKLLLVEPKTESFFDPDLLLSALYSDVLNMPMNRQSDNKNSNNSTRITESKSLKNKSITRQNSNTQRVSKITKSKPGVMKENLSLPQNENSGELLNWIWPTDGKLLNRFSSLSSASRGLDIEASLGQPVRATAPGRVVYGGNGLRGYGNLVIIKHSQNYLSAYAHNDKIHVSENEIVKSGQRIADAGNSGSNNKTGLLHFEIRYKGKPVDPLNYLPEKKF